ncbi:MAG: hypothetical protein A2283_20320 [Lentisphaerae bacterium RIFOXYA12_FULL_48_11]|nr:MAG: hypothetical protein A2283_20320 [Lentisphaerae bacterium RIFOXYA12_FULL_48_11]
MKIPIEKLVERLYGECNSGGWWEGRLSSSALSTSLAVFALASVDRQKYSNNVECGLKWLADNVNADGGWGDTPDSVSNMSTTALCWSAFSIADPVVYGRITDNTGRWLKERSGSLKPDDISAAIKTSYGEDRTFSAPILAMCALAGRLGKDESAWQFVPQLPFELVVLPRKLFRLLRLSVVSYALPALIAIGLLKFAKSNNRPSFPRMLRNLCRGKALEILRKLQPVNGGFLEATPLTSFVVMSLAGAGYAKHKVVEKGVGFLLGGVRDDGSWPIDTNLATWVTTLSVNAVSREEQGKIRRADDIRKWLLAQQFGKKHVFTDAAPGGWGWTDQPGSVPDADDTAGVLLALKRLGRLDAESVTAGLNGVKWLLDIQNGDGGVPTFCRGWGKLPFDRSCPDITAHAMRAVDAWYDQAGPALCLRIKAYMEKGFRYLCNVQVSDGRWIPLWFGNQKTPDSTNPTYGTAQVVIALAEITDSHLPSSKGNIVEKACLWLVSAQNSDGGWGGEYGVSSSVEETALAVNALAYHGYESAVERGVDWLHERFEHEHGWSPAPIGLYFAKLWYSEKLYPLIFTIAALSRVGKSK